MTNNSDKLRSLFLAGLMVMSVFAFTVGFAGSAAAANSQTLTVDDNAAEATGVTYTISGTAEAGGTVDDVELELEDADVSGASVSVSGSSGITIDSQSASGDTIDIATSGSVSGGDTVTFTVTGVTNPSDGGTYTASADLLDTNGDNIDSLSQDYTITEADDTAFVSGGTFFGGQTRTLDASNTDFSAGDTLEVHTVVNEDSGDTVGNLRRTVSVGDDGLLRLTLDGNLAEGTFVLTDQSGQVVDTDTSDSLGTSNAEDEQFDVIAQDLSANFDEDEASSTDDADEVTFDINSEVRDGFAVNVSADGLDEDDLEDIIGSENITTKYDDGTVVIPEPAENEWGFNFSDQSEGNYTFTTNVTDTLASDTDTIEVVDTGDDDATLGQAVVSEQRGDVAEIPIQLENTDTATVEIGEFDDDNYNLTVEVEDGNNDGEVILEFNTYSAGAVPQTDIVGAVVTTSNDDDDITDVRENGSFSVNAPTDPSDSVPNVPDIQSDFTRTGGPGATADKIPGQRILAATDYEIAVTNEEVLGTSSRYVTDSTDVGTLSLSDRSTESAQIWTTSSDNYDDLADADTDDDEDINAVYDAVGSDNLTQTDTIAGDDAAVVQVSASGLEGVFAYHASSYGGSNTATETYDAISSTSSTDDGNLGSGAPTVGNGVSVFEHAIEGEQGANEDDSDVDISNAGSHTVIYDENNDTHFVLIDDVKDTLNADDEDEFTANFTVYANNDRGLASDTDEGESVNDSFTVEDADATLNNGLDYTTSASAGQEISGETNVAPGTELTVRMQSDSTQSPFLLQPTAIVQPDGNFTATADFSDRSPGANFTAQTRRGGNDVGDEIDGTLVEGETATVSISDQESTGDTVTVDSATLANGGFIAIHNGSAGGEVVGASDYLEAGSHSDVEITLDSTQSEDFTAVAMPHFDTNDNEEYEFNASADDGVDAPYTDADGPVTDSASVTIVEEVSTTEEPTEVTTTEEMTDDTATETPTEGDGPGFTAVIALVALVAAALLAVRRNN